MAQTTFTFPPFTLDAMSTVRVWVKNGTNSATNLYWGNGWALWNNGGDTATLLNNGLQIVDSCTYTGSEPGGYKNCSSFVTNGDLLSLEVEHESVNVLEIHEWEFELFADETFTVTVAGDLNADFLVSIIDENDTIIVDQQNSASVDNLEVAVANNMQAGVYQIFVETVGNVAGYYAIGAFETDSLSSLPTAYKGILEDGDIIRSTVAFDHKDYWYFCAAAGDIVSISVEPFENSADMYLALFNDDVDANGPIIEVDSPTMGATEELVNYNVPLNGVYMVSISDFDFNEVEYEITLLID